MNKPSVFSASSDEPQVLPTRIVPKIWGRAVLPEPFESEVRQTHEPGEPIGEIWFGSPAALGNILVKYLFTSDKLSVQVHPSDAQAQAGEAGKEECWLILEAEPDAQLAIGFKQELSEEEMRAAALDGTIEDLLDWHTVEPGDFFYLPAGTVHAIGAGIALVEVQQSSDTTFRLYDYGRPRELHLERGIAVADRGSYASSWRDRISDGTQALVNGPHFQLTRLVGAPGSSELAQFAQPCLVLPLAGSVSLGGNEVPSGSCAFAQDISAFAFSDDAIALLVANTANTD